jgi:hypothetical protein
MRNTNKTLALLLTLIIAMQCLTLLNVNPVNAQNTPTPAMPTIPASTPDPAIYNSSIAIPTFTLQLADHSYDVPETATTTTDPYTGNTTTTTQTGYHVENKTIDLRITNQPHVSEVVPYKYTINLYYDIRYKGHYGDTWTELYDYGDDNRLPKATNSSYTEISIPQRQFSNNAQVDFQVRVINGKINIITEPFFFWTFEAGGWSNIATVNMTDGSVSIIPFTNPTVQPSPTATPTLTQTPTPSVPEISPLAIVPLLVFLLAVAVIVRRGRVIHE